MLQDCSQKEGVVSHSLGQENCAVATAKIEIVSSHSTDNLTDISSRLTQRYSEFYFFDYSFLANALKREDSLAIFFYAADEPTIPNAYLFGTTQSAQTEPYPRSNLHSLTNVDLATLAYYRDSSGARDLLTIRDFEVFTKRVGYGTQFLSLLKELTWGMIELEPLDWEARTFFKANGFADCGFKDTSIATSGVLVWMR